MDREFKSLNFSNIKAESSGRVRTGIAAVFGNIDAANDRIMPGAFAKTIAEGATRCKHLWSHSWEHPPIASIKELRELSRNELPPEVLAKAPEATGGLLVKREYYDVEFANWILKAIDAGDVNEMSFAYDVLQSSYVTESKADSDQTHEVRELKELRLYDTSDVLLGCNSATIANGAKNLNLLPLGAIASQFIAISEQIKSQVKAGRRNATNDLKLIELIHATSVGLGAICEPDTADLNNDDGKSGNPAEQHQADQQIDADEQIDAKAEADSNITSLSDLRLRAIRLQTANLRME